MESECLLRNILVIGDVGTGKTSFLKQSIHNTFTEKYVSDVGYDFFHKKIDTWKHSYDLQILNIAGSDHNIKTLDICCNKLPDAIFVMVDCTRSNTIDFAKKWKHHLESKFELSKSYPTGINPYILLVNKWEPNEPYQDHKTMIIPLDNIRIYEDLCETHGFHYWIPISVKNNKKLDTTWNSLGLLLDQMLPKANANDINVGDEKMAREISNKTGANVGNRTDTDTDLERNSNEIPTKTNINNDEKRAELFTRKLLDKIFTIISDTNRINLHKINAINIMTAHVIPFAMCHLVFNWSMIYSSLLKQTD